MRGEKLPARLCIKTTWKRRGRRGSPKKIRVDFSADDPLLATFATDMSFRQVDREWKSTVENMKSELQFSEAVRSVGSAAVRWRP